MRVKTVQSSWFADEARRLDCGPYMSGAIEARQLLNRLKVRTDRLDSLTAGYNGGIYNGPQFRRNYVESPEYGVPFLTSGTVLLADLSTLPLLSKKDAESDRLSYLQLRKGMTLISCSGTIGRMAYARPEMDGIWSSQDVMKVVADETKVPSGYLYAFLASKYGVPLVVSRTYGAIIPHLESHHLADLPVPRLGEETEQEVDQLVRRAAELRSKAAELRQQAVRRITALLDWKPMPLHTLWGEAASSLLQRRLDAFHHTAAVRLARHTLASGPNAQRLGDVVQAVFEPNRGARRQVSDATYGIPFLLSSEVFQLDPQGSYLISRHRTPNLDQLLVTEGDLWLPRSGQLGGIIGRAVLPVSTCFGFSATEDLVRVRCRSRSEAHFLWAVFTSQPGYYATIACAYGSSIPHLACGLLADLVIPWLDSASRRQIAGLVGANVDALAEAILLERDAVRRVEQAIEGAA